MTTINNNLTIEQMREIVSGAPEGAEAYSLKCSEYYYSPNTFYDFDKNKWVEMDRGVDLDLYESFIWLDDLRTAIAKHDEFKVGDLVVIKANPFWPEDYLIQKVEPEHIGKWYMNSWRHATPEEIKAGHRVDDTTDHVTDIRNHVSPSTKVIDRG